MEKGTLRDGKILAAEDDFQTSQTAKAWLGSPCVVTLTKETRPPERLSVPKPNLTLRWKQLYRCFPAKLQGNRWAL